MPALYRGPKRGYTMSDIDRLVLAASLWGEAGSHPTKQDAAAVAWSMMMRFQLMNMAWLQGGWPFGKFIRSFSQPVNPRWLDPDGAKCQAHPDHCTALRLARRAKLQDYLDNYSTAAGWERIQYAAPIPAKYADAFYEGKLPNPFSEPVYDFAACWLTKKQAASGSRPSPGIDIDGNCFLRYQDLSKSDKERVVAGRVYTGVAAHSLGGLYLAVGIVGTAAAWAWGRWS
jgi:hypothetical protein